MRKSEMAALAIFLLSLAMAVYLYLMMPEQMASHWNAQGQVDGYIGKGWGLFVFPVMLLLLFFAFYLIPRIDPLKANIAKFRGYFDIFVVIILLFLLYMYFLTIIWNLGTKFDLIWALVPAFVALFYYSGILIENAKRNWFIGIRTPWTLMNEKVWNRTHKLGGKAFKLSALIAVFGLFFEDYAIWFVLVPIMVSAAYLVVYSYFEYQKEMMKKAVRKPKKKK